MIGRLESAALCWLRYKRQCPLVMLERTPFAYWRDRYRPDVVGISRERLAIEIEIKRTAGDYNANWKKLGFQDGHPPAAPRFDQRYFLVPMAMKEHAIQNLPMGWGLIVSSERRGTDMDLNVAKAAKRWGAKPLSTALLVRAVQHQSGTLASLAKWISEKEPKS